MREYLSGVAQRVLDYLSLNIGSITKFKKVMKVIVRMRSIILTEISAFFMSTHILLFLKHVSWLFARYFIVQNK